MARSKHTRPLAIRAAERLGDPRGPRGAGDLAARRRRGALAKARGLIPPGGHAPGPGSAEADAWPLPRVVVTRPRPAHHHPASRADVAALLRALGPPACYGVRAIELRRGAGLALALGRLEAPGRIVLFDQPRPPWRLPGGTAATRARLAAAGARLLDLADGGLLVHWPPGALRAFTLDVLVHELGHHLLQHHTGKRLARVARRRDHEAFAELHVQRCARRRPAERRR